MQGDDRLPSAEDILTTHEEIEREYDMTYRGTRVPVPKRRLRTIRNQALEYDGVWMRAAFLLRKVLTAHIFEDGNKRTAWAVTRGYLDRVALEPQVERDEVPHILRRIRRYDVEELATWLETGKIDRSRLDP